MFWKNLDNGYIIYNCVKEIYNNGLLFKYYLFKYYLSFLVILLLFKYGVRFYFYYIDFSCLLNSIGGI